MSKPKPKPKEDNRDVFEKALDYAPEAGTVAGAVLGPIVLGKAARRFQRGADGIDDLVQGPLGAIGGAMIGGVAGKITKASLRNDSNQKGKKPRK